MTSLQIRKTFIPCLLLAAAFYYTHRMWGSFQVPRADTYLNLIAISHLFGGFFTAGKEVPQAFWTCFNVSAVLLWLVSLSLYLWLRACSFSPLVALIGGFIGSYTGFMMAGVWEFNHRYLLSYAAVPLVLHGFWKLAEGPKRALWAVVIVATIGLSLLGGSTSPLFFYLPLFLLIPLFVPLAGRPVVILRAPDVILRAKPERISSSVVKELAVRYFWTALVGVSAFRMASHLASLNHQTIYQMPVVVAPLTLKQTLYTLFLRDWWKMSGIQLHESDYFLGLPAVILLIAGLGTALKERKDPKARLSLFLFVCFAAGLVLSHYSNLGNPNRLFALSLLPVAYFSAVALSRATPNWIFRGTWLSIGVLLILLVRQLASRWSGLIPDARLASVVSIGFGVLASAIFMARALIEKWRESPAPLVGGALSVYLMYAFAPTPLTHYLPDYFQDTKLISEVPAERLSLASVVGIKSWYPENLERLREGLKSTPVQPPLPEIQVGQGEKVEILASLLH